MEGIRKAGVLVGARKELNLIEGSNVTLTVADSSSGSNRIDVTIEASASQSQVAGVVPVGGIVMWSGTIATIPASWALCDGTANSPGPDLRDTFVVGARQDGSGVAKTNITGALTASGGSTSHHHANHATTQPAAHSDHVFTQANGHSAHVVTQPADHAALTNNHSGGGVDAHAGTAVGVSGAGSAHTHTQGAVTQPSAHADNIAHTHGLNVQGGTTAATTGTHIMTSTATGGSARAITSGDAGLSSGTGASLTHSGTAVANPANESAHTHAAGTVTQPNAHTFTQPTAHGAISSHASTAVDAHSAHAGSGVDSHSAHSGAAVDAHDTLTAIQPYYALAYIQRMT